MTRNMSCEKHHSSAVSLRKNRNNVQYFQILIEIFNDTPHYSFQFVIHTSSKMNFTSSILLHFCEGFEAVISSSTGIQFSQIKKK